MYLNILQEYDRRKEESEAERLKNGVLPSLQQQQLLLQEVEEQKKTRAEIIHARIGFDPAPKLSWEIQLFWIILLKYSGDLNTRHVWLSNVQIFKWHSKTGPIISKQNGIENVQNRT